LALRTGSAFYTYSKSRGLFAGISLESGAFIERKGANRKIYGDRVRARDLLSGRIAPPPEADVLFDALNEAVRGQVQAATNDMANKFAASCGVPLGVCV
jgi:lipid-binding SYLF domain-containing protein